MLGGLVATRQQKNKVTASVCVVHPVAGAYIYTQLRYASLQIAVISRIPVSEPPNAREDPRAARCVPQAVDPLSELGGARNLHAPTVAYRLHTIKPVHEVGRAMRCPAARAFCASMQIATSEDGAVHRCFVEKSDYLRQISSHLSILDTIRRNYAIDPEPWGRTSGAQHA